MATEQVDIVEQEMDLPALCRAVGDASPMPMAGLGGPLHTLRYVNLAFCLLTGKSKDELIGTAFCGIAPCTNECMLLLDRVAKTGPGDSYTGQENTGIHPLYWSYAMWPLLGADHSHLGIIVQVTEAAKFHGDAVAMNQALLLGSVRQHELTEAAELLNVQLPGSSDHLRKEGGRGADRQREAGLNRTDGCSARARDQQPSRSRNEPLVPGANDRRHPSTGASVFKRWRMMN
jgi:hypothetical protein